jgi:hypothetical protein
VILFGPMTIKEVFDETSWSNFSKRRKKNDFNQDDFYYRYLPSVLVSFGRIRTVLAWAVP